jgi:hypothetical protein
MKPTKAILQQRLEGILEIRLCGATFYDARRYVAEKETAGEQPWTIPSDGKPVSERTLWRYIKQTDGMIAQTCREGRKKLLRRHQAQRRNLFAKCVNMGDMRAALACLDSEAKLCGLFDDELNRMVEKLAKELAELKANGDPAKTTPADASRSDDAPQPGDDHPDPAAEQSRTPDGVPGPDAGRLADGVAQGLLTDDDLPPLFG